MGLFGPPNVEKMKAKRDIKGLIKALGYRKDWRVREKAAEALGQTNDPRAIEPLCAALGGYSPSGSVESAAVRALVRIGTPAVEPLGAALKHACRPEAAASALIKIGKPSVGPLVDGLEHWHPFTRKTAADALGMIGDARAAEPLVAALNDSVSDVSRAAIEALARIGQPATEALVAALTKDSSFSRAKWEVVEALDKIGWQPGREESGAAYWVAKQNWNECVRVGSTAVEPLISVLAHSHNQARKAAADALGQIGDARAVEPLIVALKDREIRQCGAVEDALVKIGGPAVEPLVAAFKNGDFEVRFDAVTLLGKIGDARAVEPLIAALALRNVPLPTAEALGRIGDVRAVGPLIAALEDEPRPAAEALGNIGDARAVEPLIGALERAPDAAARALGKIGDARAVESLIAALKNTAPAAAAEALGRIGDARAVEPLIAALKDAAPAAAAEALGRIGDARAAEPLIAALERAPAAAARALGKMGDSRAVEPLVAALFDGAWPVRQAAGEALVELYQSDLLDEAHKSLILAQRGCISEVHEDRTQDHTEGCVGKHVDEHADRGIGVAFPA